MNGDEDICIATTKADQKLEQLQSLLLLISETSFDTFTMMGEPCQKSVLTLAYDLSLAVSR